MDVPEDARKPSLPMASKDQTFAGVFCCLILGAEAADQLRVVLKLLTEPCRTGQVEKALQFVSDGVANLALANSVWTCPGARGERQERCNRNPPGRE